MPRLRLVLLLGAVAIVSGLALHPSSGLAQSPSTVATFRGSYNGFSTPEVLGPFPLHAGLTVIRSRHNGTANFVVSLVTAEPGKTPQDSYANRYLVSDGIGRFDGGGAVIVREDGEYYLLLAAGGAYEITVEQPSPSTVTAVNERSFSGSGQQVTPVFRLAAGTVTIDAQTDQEFLTVWLYLIDDLGGAAVGPGYDGRIIDTTRGTGTTVSVDVPAGLYMLATATGVTNERWSLSVQQ